MLSDSLGKDVCCQVCQPGFDSQDPQGQSGELAQFIVYTMFLCLTACGLHYFTFSSWADAYIISEKCTLPMGRPTYIDIILIWFVQSNYLKWTSLVSLILFVWASCLNVCMFTMRVCMVPTRPDDGIRYPRTRVMNGCEQTCVGDQIWVLLQVHKVLSASESSLQHLATLSLLAVIIKDFFLGWDSVI